jgi:hypothetical protein
MELNVGLLEKWKGKSEEAITKDNSEINMINMPVRKCQNETIYFA